MMVCYTFYMIFEKKSLFTVTSLLFGVAGTVWLWVGGCSQDTLQKAQKKKPYVMTESRTIYTKSTKDITRLFSDVNYSVKRWQSGDREIPRIYLTDISSRWEQQASRIPVKSKKEIFFQLTLPLILRSNEMILYNRDQLMALSTRYPDVTSDEMKWLQKMAKRYKLSKKPDDPFDQDKLEKLKLRMNIIPPSLALAQAAEESGWGTSRFAVLGNSLFGQWDFSGKGMVPAQQRKELGNYGLKRFETPLHAVQGYMLNLNTHRAYKKLRIKRAELEAMGEPITGYALAETLDRYSERGYAYVESLHKMMGYNQLAHVDDAYLWDKETIFMTPLPDPKPSPAPAAKQPPVADKKSAGVSGIIKQAEAAEIVHDENITALPDGLADDMNQSRENTELAEKADDENITVFPSGTVEVDLKAGETVPAVETGLDINQASKQNLALAVVEDNATAAESNITSK